MQSAPSLSMDFFSTGWAPAARTQKDKAAEELRPQSAIPARDLAEVSAALQAASGAHPFSGIRKEPVLEKILMNQLAFLQAYPYLIIGLQKELLLASLHSGTKPPGDVDWLREWSRQQMPMEDRFSRTDAFRAECYGALGFHLPLECSSVVAAALKRLSKDLLHADEPERAAVLLGFELHLQHALAALQKRLRAMHFPSEACAAVFAGPLKLCRQRLQRCSQRQWADFYRRIERHYCRQRQIAEKLVHKARRTDW